MSCDARDYSHQMWRNRFALKTLCCHPKFFDSDDNSNGAAQTYSSGHTELSLEVPAGENDQSETVPSMNIFFANMSLKGQSEEPSIDFSFVSTRNSTTLTRQIARKSAI